MSPAKWLRSCFHELTNDKTLFVCAGCCSVLIRRGFIVNLFNVNSSWHFCVEWNDCGGFYIKHLEVNSIHFFPVCLSFFSRCFIWNLVIKLRIISEHFNKNEFLFTIKTTQTIYFIDLALECRTSLCNFCLFATSSIKKVPCKSLQ